MKDRQIGKNTKCVHSGNQVSPEVGGVNTPIYASTSFLYPNPADPSGEVRYPRHFNIPTHEAPARKIADLEHGERGLVLGSGMAAISTALFALLRRGDHAVFQRDLYGGTHRFVVSELGDFGIEVSVAKGNSVSDIEAEVRPNTKALYIETPSNPLLNVVDLEAVAALAKRRGLLTVIDNTFATPINQIPIDFGIDVVVHSGTKYLGGHSDINCGAIVASGELMKRIMPFAENHGATLDVHACYLLERSLKTLGLRMARHNENAMRLAELLSGHPRVRKVYYPGLRSHEGRQTARRQMSGFGGVLSFELDADAEGAREMVSRLSVITRAVSLGGVESLICFPSETSHERMSPEERAAAGITDSLIRLSVGIEDADDLEADLKEMLEG